MAFVSNEVFKHIGYEFETHDISKLTMISMQIKTNRR